MTSSEKCRHYTQQSGKEVLHVDKSTRDGPSFCQEIKAFECNVLFVASLQQSRKVWLRVYV